MKIFLTRTILFIFPLIIIFYPLDYFVTQGLKKTNYRDYAEWNDLFAGRINADVLISGSSVAWVQISPKVIEDMTNCNAYNLGIDGYRFYMQYKRYLSYVKYNKKPKIIIQTIDNNLLTKREDLYNYEQFLPYLDDQIISDSVYKYRGLAHWDKIVPFHKYIGEYDLIKVGTLEYFNLKTFSNGKYKGYKANNKKWDGRILENLIKSRTKLKVKRNKQITRIFEEFLENCKKKNIKVFLVYTPRYKKSTSLVVNQSEIIDYYKKIAKKYNARFLDYTNSYLSKDKKYFYNATHLNSKGSLLFTKQLIDDISQKDNTFLCKGKI